MELSEERVDWLASVCVSTSRIVLMLRVWWVGFEFLHLQLPLLFHCRHAPLLSLPHDS